MNIKRYIIPSRVERTVVRVPVTGNKLSLRTVMKIMKDQSIPRTATVRVATTMDNRTFTTRRYLRFEWPTETTVA